MAKLYPKRIDARATPAEHRKLLSRAKTSRRSLSRYLIVCGLSAPDPPPPVALDTETKALYEEAIYHLAAIGNNLNQLTHRAHVFHADGGTIPQAELLRVINVLHARVRALADASTRNRNGI
jgi:hypothetical protein